QLSTRLRLLRKNISRTPEVRGSVPQQPACAAIAMLLRAQGPHRSRVRIEVVANVSTGEERTSLLGDTRMPEHVYKIIELVGSSNSSVEDAVQGAVGRASETISNLDWFEVKEIRGSIQGGKV